MRMNVFLLLFMMVLSSSPTTTLAFVHYYDAARTTSTCLTMAPRFDKTTQTWVATKDDELPSAGYPPIGSLLRQGPAPYLQRMFKPDQYEQAILKFMATDKCTRNEAQGNMDAYLRNPADWTFSRMEAQNKGIKIDYVKLDIKTIALTTVWSAIVLVVVGRVGYSLFGQQQFWDFF